MAVIQRGSGALRLNPHLHVLFLDGTYLPDGRGGAPLFRPAPGPTDADVQAAVHRARRGFLRYLERRGVITAAAPGDGELSVVPGDEAIGSTCVPGAARARTRPSQAPSAGALN
ncbi:MAG: hypothetical protein ABI560_15700, partial [Myxococcales bacterium]